MFADELLDFIFETENNGIKYDYWHSGYKGDRSKKLTDMTIAEVLAAQKDSRNAGGNSAAGAGQIIYKTLSHLVDKGVASPSEPFSIETQRRLHKHLLNKRGLGKYMSGQMSALDFGNNLAKEYAALPLLSNVGEKRAGKSYYGGDGKNKALTDIDSFRAALSLGSSEDVLDEVFPESSVGANFLGEVAEQAPVGTPAAATQYVSKGKSSPESYMIDVFEASSDTTTPDTTTQAIPASVEAAKEELDSDRVDRNLGIMSMIMDKVRAEERPMPLPGIGLYSNVRSNRKPTDRFGIASLG
tara:strand:- start:102 stop:998 length:897 start_codon:yes stop_codon:yes gene_type:complete